jgi:hypothetical protein
MPLPFAGAFTIITVDHKLEEPPHKHEEPCSKYDEKKRVDDIGAKLGYQGITHA